MKRRTEILFTALLLICLFLIIKMNLGSTWKSEKTIVSNELYSEYEIDQAMNRVKTHFRLHFKGCTLLELVYDDAKQIPEWADVYGDDDAILLISRFKVGDSGGDGSLNPDTIYGGFQWILTRKKDGKWVLRTWGYG